LAVFLVWLYGGKLIHCGAGESTGGPRAHVRLLLLLLLRLKLLLLALSTKVAL
jgi:hypothetical protein